MIKEIIKENMEYFNLSNADLALMTGISERTIRNVVSGETKPSLESLSSFEDAFKLERGDLYPYYNQIKYTGGSDEVFKSIDDSLGNVYAKETIYNKMRKLFSGTLDSFKNLLSVKSVDYYKFKDKDLAYLWMALNDKKAIGISTLGEYKSANKTKIFNSYLEIMFSKEDINTRIDLMTNKLSENGIILINSPYIKGSVIRGATLKKNKVRYIFMNDMGKREYSYIFTLGHELKHVSGIKEENNDELADKIEKYLSKNDIDHEIKYSFELFKQKNNQRFNDEDWEYLRNKTKLKLNFGDAKTFIQEHIE